jgi:serine/threonine-protein kinase
MAWKGDTKAVRAVLERAPEPTSVYQTRVKLEWCDRDFEQALVGLATAPRENLMDQVAVPLFTGFTYRFLDRPTEAREAFASAASVLASATARQPEAPLLRVLLGLAHAGLGNKEDAIRAGEAAVRLAAADQVLKPLVQQYLAWIHATVGGQDAAIDLLEHLLETDYLQCVTTAHLRLDPTWDPLRDHPRFQALLD